MKWKLDIQQTKQVKLYKKSIIGLINGNGLQPLKCPVMAKKGIFLDIFL